MSKNTMETLPCGCRHGTDVIDGVRTYLYEPCSLQCKYYLYVLEQSKAQGNKITKIDTR